MTAVTYWLSRGERRVNVTVRPTPVFSADAELLQGVIAETVDVWFEVLAAMQAGQAVIEAPVSTALERVGGDIMAHEILSKPLVTVWGDCKYKHAQDLTLTVDCDTDPQQALDGLVAMLRCIKGWRSDDPPPGAQPEPAAAAASGGSPFKVDNPTRQPPDANGYQQVAWLPKKAERVVGDKYVMPVSRLEYKPDVGGKDIIRFWGQSKFPLHAIYIYRPNSTEYTPDATRLQEALAELDWEPKMADTELKCSLRLYLSVVESKGQIYTNVDRVEVVT